MTWDPRARASCCPAAGSGRTFCQEGVHSYASFSQPFGTQMPVWPRCLASCGSTLLASPRKQREKHTCIPTETMRGQFVCARSCQPSTSSSCCCFGMELQNLVLEAGLFRMHVLVRGGCSHFQKVCLKALLRGIQCTSLSQAHGSIPEGEHQIT